MHYKLAPCLIFIELNMKLILNMINFQRFFSLLIDRNDLVKSYFADRTIKRCYMCVI